MDLDEYRFSAEHHWVRIDDDDHATVGLSEEAFQEIDDVNKIRLPSEGEEFSKDETFGRLTTSRRSVLRLYMPVSGEVVEVNEDLLDAPEMIMEDPYEEGWLMRIAITNMSEYDELMTREEYEDYLSDETAEDDDLDDAVDDDEDSDEEDEEEDY